MLQDTPSRGGDMAAGADSWTDWLNRHGPALVLLARQWVASRADAEDVVQEAFVRFWRTRERVADPAAYLYGCVKHVALDDLRGRQRRARREEVIARPEAEPLFEDRLELDERRASIEAALRELPADQSEVLIMRIWGGLTFPQIATALDLPVNTASSRYRCALNKLREQLSELREQLAEEPLR